MGQLPYLVPVPAPASPRSSRPRELNLCDDLPSNYPSACGIGARDTRAAVAVTASETATIDLGRFGYFGLGATPDQAREIERLGYGTIWGGGSPAAEMSFV